MQIKKNTRDAHYPDAAQYEQTGYASDSTDQFGDAPESFSVRPARSGVQTPAAPLGESGERTAAQRSESVIDQHSSFDGRFETEQDLRVDVLTIQNGNNLALRANDWQVIDPVLVHHIQSVAPGGSLRDDVGGHWRHGLQRVL